MRKLSIILGLLLLMMSFTGMVSATTDIMGMGNAPGPATPGDNGIYWNPAAMSPGNVFVLDLNLLNTTLRTDALSVLDILEYGGLVEGTDSHWTKEEVTEILSKIPEDGFSLYFNHVTRPKMIIGPVGISVGVEAYSRSTLDKDIFNLLLKGNADYVDFDGTGPKNYLDLSETGANLIATADAALTLSFPIQEAIPVLNENFDEFYVGGGIHLVAGGYGNVALTDATSFYLSYGEPDEEGLQTLDIRFADAKTREELLEELEDGEMYPILKGLYTLDADNPTDTSYLGQGTAFDLGVYVEKGPFNFGLSVMNLGSLTFDNYQIIEYGLIRDSSEELGFVLSEEPVTRQGNTQIKVPLPSRINAGVSYQHGHWFLAGLQLSSINNVSVNLDADDQVTTTSVRNFELGAGIELNPLWILPIRVGLIKGKNSLTYTGGIGLHLGPLHTDLAVAASYKSASIGLNTSLEF